MQYAPTRVHEKLIQFHISAPEYTKNTPDFTFPNRDTPKTGPILDPNLWRGTFRGVCNTPLHGYVQNLAGFIFPHPNTPKTHPILDPNLWRGTFRGVCFCAPTRVRAKFGRFHIFPSGYAKNAPDFPFPNRDAPKNAPDFTLPNKDTPKTHPISPIPIGISPKPARF